MTIERKVGMGIAGQPSGSVNVAEVFSTQLHVGNGGTKTITSGIDISGEGGLVITKAREVVEGMNFTDTVRGAPNRVRSNVNDPSASLSTGLTAFNSTGHVYGSNSEVNQNTKKFVSYTFRKKEKFFDIVTYSGNGVAGRQIAHGLGSVPGMIIVKKVSSNGNWAVYHGANTNAPETEVLFLNSTDATWDVNTAWNDTAPTDSVFTVGTMGSVNGTGDGSGDTFVAYLFADNSSEDVNNRMIKCGSYTGNGGVQSISVGFEPQFILVKNTSDASRSWNMYDTMRGIAIGNNDAWLKAESANAEGNYNFFSELTTTGFQWRTGDGQTNKASEQYVYMAIRAPMMKEPEAATEVFAVDNGNGSDVPAFNSGFPIDMAFWSNTQGGHTKIADRLIGGGKHLETDAPDGFLTDSAHAFDYQTGWHDSAQYSSRYSYMWKRAKGFFDVVSYTGNATVRTIPHSLGVAPEMIWVKADTNDHWKTMTDTGSITSIMDLNRDVDSGSSIAYFFGNGSTYTAPTDSVFTIGTQGNVNLNNTRVVAYLFATLAGISKVGNYTGNGSSQTINCGFSAGAKYILIKRTDAEGSWYVWDSLKGIVAGNDPYFILNGTGADVTNNDSVDPHNSGFIVNHGTDTDTNVSSGTYIFYAIA